jgi:hypothetical protein
LERGAPVRELIFGDAEPAALVSEFCERHLGSAIARIEFESTSVGHVVGAELEDGRRVVVKAHQPREPAARLAAVLRIQAHHHDNGFPCPRPLTGPEELGRGLGTAEELLDEGQPRDTHEPPARAAVAELLVAHLDLSRSSGAAEGLRGGWELIVRDTLWPPEAHSPIFDFEATAAGAEWIDEVAALAKPLAVGDGPPVAGHMDWSGEHFRFDGDRITAVYDWDSLALRPEHQVIGVAAATFTASPALGVDIAPAPDEVRAFLDEFAAARPEPLSPAERERVHAVATYVIAYIARCEHALGESDRPGTFSAALRLHGADYLHA